MMGKTFTYLIGSDSSSIFFNSRNDDLNAEEVYARLVTPVFGKGVCYDVPHDVCITLYCNKIMFLTDISGAEENAKIRIEYSSVSTLYSTNRERN